NALLNGRRRPGRTAAVVGDCKEAYGACATNFSNCEMISHNTKYCCDASRNGGIRARTCRELHETTPQYCCFTPIGSGTLRYNSSHVDRSAFRTFGAAVRSPGGFGAVTLAPRTVVVQFVS